MKTAYELHVIAIELENDGVFCRHYPMNESYRARRDEIKSAMKRYGHGLDSVEEREQLRRYFDNSMTLGEPDEGRNSYGDVATIEFWKDEVRNPDLTIRGQEPKTSTKQIVDIDGALFSVLPDPPQENIMSITNNPAIKITTRTYVGTTDIATISDSQIFGMIAIQEGEIKLLETIENKPKKLVAEIEKRKAGIAALVAHLDSKE